MDRFRKDETLTAEKLNELDQLLSQRMASTGDLIVSGSRAGSFGNRVVDVESWLGFCDLGILDGLYPWRGHGTFEQYSGGTPRAFTAASGTFLKIDEVDYPYGRCLVETDGLGNVTNGDEAHSVWCYHRFYAHSGFYAVPSSIFWPEGIPKCFFKMTAVPEEQFPPPGTMIQRPGTVTGGYDEMLEEFIQEGGYVWIATPICSGWFIDEDYWPEGYAR